MKRVAAGAIALAVLGAARVASAADCGNRPTDPPGFGGYTYGAAEVKTYDTALVRVHYATSGMHAPDLTTTRSDGVPDTVAFAGDTGQDALTQYAAMGYRAPPSDADCASNGGDAHLDIYLLSFAGADGTTTPIDCQGIACASFVMSESTFDGRGYANAQEGFKTVVTHELFHTVQNAYDSTLDRFWAEGTAQWAMKTLHPELQDFERQLPAFFSDTTRSLDSLPSGVTAGYLYGSAVWPLFLTLTEGPDTVRTILEGEADGTEAIAATDKYLQTKGSSLAATFPLFAAWNAATKDLAGTGGYPEAPVYPGVKVAALADGVTGITSGLSYFAFSGTVDDAQKITLDTDATRNGGMLVPLENGKARIDMATPLPADVAAGATVLVVVAGITTKKTDAPFTITFAAPDATTPDAGTSSGGSSSSSSGCAVVRGASGAESIAPLAVLFALALTRRRRGS